MDIQDSVEIRKGESFSHAKEIVQPFGGLDSVISWCKQTMENEWRWQLCEVSSDIRPGRYIFYFDSERDYCAFLMRWA